MAAPAEEKIEDSEDYSRFLATCVKFLEGKNVADVIGGLKDPLITKSDDKLLEACKLLMDSKINSTPVLDGKKVVGLLDMSSILKYYINQAKTEDKKEVSIFAQVDEAMPSGDAVKKKTISVKEKKEKPRSEITVNYLARMKRFQSTKVDSTLFECATKLVGTPSLGLMKGDDIAAVMSQGHLVKIINSADILKDLKLTMGELVKTGRATSPVKSAKCSDTAMATLKEMSRKGLSTFAVCDGEGKIIGDINVRDVTHWETAGCKHSMTNRELNGKTKDTVLVKESSTIGEALTAMLDGKQHRCYIVDADGKPIGVFSYTDFYKMLK